ncbi:MAG: hypothetical protein R3277_04740 [Brumimicrobium sp.]|nr:hypothetical protein [Brumimicrobium sp.]
MSSKNILYLIFTAVLIVSGSFACKKNDSGGVVTDNNSGVGASANALLSEDYYEKIVVEVMYMPGFAPTQSSLNNLRNFLLNHTNKPLGVDVISREINSSGQTTYSMADIQSLENSNRQYFNEGKTITTSMIIVDGEYATNDQVLGVAYKNTSTVIFGKTIHDNSGGLSQPTRTKLESTVFNHEFGHLLGLVDIGSPMVNNHEDPGHESHCDNDNCLMYYASQTTEITSFLLGSDIPELDQNCKNDLIANGGK